MMEDYYGFLYILYIIDSFSMSGLRRANIWARSYPAACNTLEAKENRISLYVNMPHSLHGSNWIKFKVYKNNDETTEHRWAK